VIKFYYAPGPNPAKVALFLEESGLAYQFMPIDTRRGEQFAPEFLAINPNAKTPALVDGDIVVFDSNAILLYLAEKTGLFLPEKTPTSQAQLLSWLMFVATGLGPYSGQAVHFKHFAPAPQDYAITRYSYEAERHWGIIDVQLANHPFMLGDTYTIVDMAVWGWATRAPFVLGEEAYGKLSNLHRLVALINERPAAQRAFALKDKHAFKTDMDAEARRFMFPQIHA